MSVIKFIALFLLIQISHVGLSQDNGPLQRAISLEAKARKHLNSNVDSASYYTHILGKLGTNENLDNIKYTALIIKARIHFIKGEYDSSVLLLKSNVKLAQQMDSAKLLSDAYRILGQSYLRKGNNDSAIYFVTKAMNIVEGTQDWKAICYCKLELGNIHYTNRAFAKAIKNYLYIDSVYAKRGHTDVSHGNILMSTGYMYLQQANFDKAIFYGKKSEKIYTRFEDSLGIYNVKGLLGSAYLYQQQFDSAITNFNQAKDYYWRTENRYKVAEVNYFLGQAYSGIREFEASEKVLLESIVLGKDLGVTHILVEAYLNIAETYYFSKQYQKSVDAAKKVLELSEPSVYADAHSFISDGYLKLKNYELAYRHSNLYHDYLDSIQKINEKQQFLELEAKYESDKKDEKIRQSKQTNELLKRQQWLYALIVGLLLLIPIFYLALRNKNKKKEFQANMVNMRMASLKSQMSPHFMFNSINSIKGLIINNEAEDAADQLTKFSKLMRGILNYSGTKTISLAKEIEFLKLYEDVENFKSRRNIEIHTKIAVELDVEEVEILPFIIQPFIENCFKHAFIKHIEHPRIELKMEKNKNWLAISIIDNGVGIAHKNEGHLSKGTELVKERLRLHNGKKDNVKIVFNGKDKGTVVNIMYRLS